MLTTKNNQFRINDSMLLLSYDNLTSNQNLVDYYFHKNSNKPNEPIQYFNQQELKNIVWAEHLQYARFLNKNHVGTILVDINSPGVEHITIKQKTLSLFLRSGFDFTNVFGILVVIKKMGNQYAQKILTSKILFTNDFKINENQELIDGSFWTVSCDFNIPDITNESLMISCEVIKFSDTISITENINFTSLLSITKYPVNDSYFEPLISVLSLPDYIQNNLEILKNGFLKIEVKTTEQNKTLGETLKNYFNDTNNISNIDINHTITYGYTDNYKQLKIKNVDNVFGSLIIGLDFSSFQLDINNPTINILLTTEINYNNTLLVRENSIVFPYHEMLNQLASLFIPTKSNLFPVNVVKETVVNQTVVNQTVEKEIVPIYQSVYIELVKENFKYENKNISFDDIKEKSVLYVGPERKVYTTSIEIGNKYYFDLNNIVKPENNIQYEIVSLINNKLIKKGIIEI